MSCWIRLARVLATSRRCPAAHAALRYQCSGQLLLVATGAEVHLILAAARELRKEGIDPTVISMPSFRIFEEQEQNYKDSIFPAQVPAVSVEAGATLGWYKYIGHRGVAIGLDRFGASAPGPLALEKLGILLPRILEAARSLVRAR